MPESHKEARKFFDATVDIYQERAERHIFNFSSLIFQRRINIVERFLSDVPQGGEVLDFGMGPAVFALFCVDRELEYTGIDISPQMVARAKSMELKNTNYLVGDLEALNDFRGSKDVVMAIGLLDYLDDVMHGIETLAECVKPGGLLILSFRNRFSVPGKLRDGSKRMWQFLRQGEPSRTDKTFFAPVHEKSFDFFTELRPALADFEDFEVAYFNCSPFFFNFPLPVWLWQIWYKLDGWLARPLTRYMYSGGVLAARRHSS